MRLGRVVGSVWGAKHAAGLDGAKLLVVEDGRGGRVTAIDRLGAGAGDRVLVAHGTRVRDLTVGETIALKDVIVAIVDGVFDAGDGVDEAGA
ncbi:MAG TPA: EutN/CcmL family microcompartment protein [Polyangia bacterium]|jgi:ethanolamine utilization protein EutN